MAHVERLVTQPVLRMRMAHAARHSVRERTWQAVNDLLVSHYRELLRAHVVMGVGNLAREMTALASLLVEAGISDMNQRHLRAQPRYRGGRSLQPGHRDDLVLGERAREAGGHHQHRRHAPSQSGASGAGSAAMR